MVAGTRDGVDGAVRGLLFDQNFFEISDRFVGMEAMQVNINLGGSGVVFVALFVQNVGSFTVSFSHQVVFILTADT